MIRCARTPLGSRLASGRQTPIFWTSIFQMEAMRLRLAVRRSPRVSLIWTSGSPSFSCSTTSSSPGLETSPWEPWVLPDEFCMSRDTLKRQAHRVSSPCAVSMHTHLHAGHVHPLPDAWCPNAIWHVAMAVSQDTSAKLRYENAMHAHTPDTPLQQLQQKPTWHTTI